MFRTDGFQIGTDHKSHGGCISS